MNEITERKNQAEQKAEEYRLALAEAIQQGQEWKDKYLDYKERYTEAVKLCGELNEELKIKTGGTVNNQTYARFLACG
jgi:hypothetical protein